MNLVYALTNPKFFVGQTVTFVHHNKRTMTGRIVLVETHYSRKLDQSVVSGRHSYAVSTPTAKKRSVWVGESNILGVVSNDL